MHRKLVEEAVQRVKLSWPLRVEDAPEEITTRCISTLGEGHRLLVDRYTMADPLGRSYLLRHEVCHFLLAERYDIAFATIAFDRWYDKAAVSAVFQAWTIVLDPLVNRVRGEYWPEDTMTENDSVIKEFDLLSRHRPEAFDDPNEGKYLRLILGLTQYEILKNDLGLDVSPIKRRLGPGGHEEVNRVSRFLHNLGALPEKPREAVRFLEENVREALRALYLPYDIRFDLSVPGAARWRVFSQRKE